MPLLIFGKFLFADLPKTRSETTTLKSCCKFFNETPVLHILIKNYARENIINILLEIRKHTFYNQKQNL